MAITRITAPALQSVREPNFRNICINGNMAVSQRATSATGIGNGDNGCQTVDRFSFYEEGATSGEFTMSQDTDVPTGQGFATSVKLDCTTADGSLAVAEVVALEYKMEGQDLQYLKKGTSNAESLTLSFWVKTNKTGTYVANFYDNDNDRQTSQNYTVSSADTWEKKTITFAADTSGTLTNDNTLALAMYFILGAGTSYTSGSAATAWETFTGNADNWAGGQTVNMLDNTANYINITGVQLEAGSVATDFEVVPYDQNLRRCLRYFVVFNSSFYPTDGTGQSPIGMGFYNNATTGIVCINTKVPMRAYPSASISNVTHFDSEPFDEEPSAISIYSQGSSYVPMLTVTTPSRTQGYAYCLVMDNADGYLHLSSEL